MNKKPVYPKDDPEYKKSIMDRFYKKVKETNWESECDKPKRGRQSKTKYEGRKIAKPRESEKYNWLDK